MIYLFAALYKEAESMIQTFKLKKVCQNNKFQEFVNEDKGICLVITGVGSISSAVAVSHVCTKYGVQEEDFLVNIGICASTETVGETYLCNKIIDEYTGKTFYPDMLFKHDLKECQVLTCGTVVNDGLTRRNQEQCQEQLQKQEIYVYDMEAAAIYQAGTFFFAPHQMSFIKIVSDNGAGEAITPKQIEAVMGNACPMVVEYIERLCEIASKEKAKRKEFSDKQKECIKKVCEDLHCSQTMEYSLYQYFRYLLLTGVDIKKQIQRWYEDGKLPCKNRREGKKRFEELKAGLF